MGELFQNECLDETEMITGVDVEAHGGLSLDGRCGRMSRMRGVRRARARDRRRGGIVITLFSLRN